MSLEGPREGGALISVSIP